MKSIKLTCCIAALFSSFCFAEKQDYKCYLETSFGEKIAFFSWEAKDASKKQMLLTGKIVGKQQGVESYVKQVYECAPMNKDFGSAAAKALDKITLK